MAEKVNEKPIEKEEAKAEGPEKTEEEPEGEKTGAKTGNMSALLSPEGIAMLALAAMLDLLSLICVLLGAIFGVGLILAKIVYVLGLVLIGGWVFLRSGSVPSIGKGKPGKKEPTEMAKKQLVDFLKKHSKKLVGKVIPIVGDIIPFWIITVYSELTSKK